MESPMPQVRIPPPYRGPTQGLAELEVRGSTVRECIAAAEARYPGFAGQIFDAGGRLHGFVTLFVNGEEIGRDAVDSAIGASDVVEILAAIAGG
jgi:molybdopterin converting factor small subunit